MLNNVVEEFAVVRHDDTRAGRVDEVLLKPSYVLDVKMIRWFIEKEDIWIFEDSTAKCKLHLPATRKRCDGTFELRLEETKFKELGLDFRAWELMLTCASFISVQPMTVCSVSAASR